RFVHSLRAAVVATFLFLPGLARAQTPRVDVIRGHVIAADSSPIQNATVMVADTVAKVPKPTRTDAKGNFSVSFENGSGVYMVAVQMLGNAPQRRVVTRPADG